jgi:signal transduction histidine kinase
VSTTPPHPWRLGPRGQWWFDVGLVCALALPALATPLTDAGWLGLALSLGQIVPLYWRRHHASASFAAVAVASAAQPIAIDTPLWSQVAFPVAVYSVARYSTTVRGLLAVAVGLCGAVVASFVWVRGYDGDPTAGSVLSYTITIDTIVVTAWALGALARTRRAYVDALVERGEQIQREAVQQVALAASDERARIAREMHDVVAHGLSMIVVQADGARYAARQDPAAATDALETISATGREALDEMRRMLGLLRADDGTELRPQPGLADLEALVAEARTAGLRVDASLPAPPPPVPDGVALTAYRVVQEALTNVRKHAGPDVTVRVGVDVGDDVRLLVEDDGRGAAVPDGRGLGLVGMRERVAVHGGTVEAGPRPGGGFRVSARLPL